MSDSGDDNNLSTNHDDENLGLPKTTVYKLIQEYLPAEFSCAKDAKDLITECCKEFVLAISSEANEISDKEQKKTMLPEHVLAALTALGFESFVTPVSSLLADHKELAKGERKKKASMKNAGGASGLTQEELLEQQELLFAASRKRYEEGTAAGVGSSAAGKAEDEDDE